MYGYLSLMLCNPAPFIACCLTTVTLEITILLVRGIFIQLFIFLLVFQ